MRSLGWVIGGPDTVVAALLEAVGAEGTIMAYAGWDQDPFHLPEWPAAVAEAALSELPAFEPAVSEANRDHGRIPERIRTWPGAVRGSHPEASMVAVGPNAAWLVDPHPSDDAHADGTPFSRLREADGSVLMLGAPLGAITLLHHAEALAEAPGKRRVTYRMPVIVDGAAVWRTFHDIDTSEGAFDYAAVVEGDAFEAIALDAIRAGVGVQGPVGASTSSLFDADAVTRFAIGWIEARFRPEPENS
jgi:aminoglycoside 3-N-acetyltransferase